MEKKKPTAKKTKLNQFTDVQVNEFAKQVNDKLGEAIRITDKLIDTHKKNTKCLDKHYSDVENAIMEWSRDGNKTAGTLTRKIFRILKRK